MTTKLFRDALMFACELHHEHKRKGTEIDYLSHLMSVAALVMEHGGTEQEAIAGLLHDSIEDQGDDYKSPVSGLREPGTAPRLVPGFREPDTNKGREALKRDLAEFFGEPVRDIVVACTDDEDYPAGHKAADTSVGAWRERKQRYLDKLSKTRHAGILRVSSADKLHNARAILSDYEMLGDALWPRFGQKTRDDHLWYYESLAATFTERAAAIGDEGVERLARELTRVVRRLRDITSA